jgi:cell division septation protein DedD
MPSKASNREEEFELVLGNKQLLSLFFIVVGFFAAFFSVGYMVGFGHGEKTGADSGLAQVEEPPPKPEEPRLPATLLQDPPEPPPSAPTASVSKPSPVNEPTPDPTPPQSPATAKPTQTVPEKPATAAPAPATATKPSPTPPKTSPTTAAASAPASGTYYLQVAAVRVEADALELAGKLKEKGYPASVNAGQGDGWQRVVVGPFQSPEAASAFKTKLSADGFDTMLRKL